MDLKLSLKVTSWILTVGALIFLWLSLRSPDYQMEYSIVALVIWGIAMLVNYFIKKLHAKNTEED